MYRHQESCLHVCVIICRLIYKLLISKPLRDRLSHKPVGPPGPQLSVPYTSLTVQPASSVFCVDEPPAVDLLAARRLGDVSDNQRSHQDTGEDRPDVEVYKVVSLPVMIARCVTAPIRAQLVSLVSYYYYCYCVVIVGA